MVELMVQISSSLLVKNVSSFARFLQYPQTDLYQFFALSKRYIKDEIKFNQGIKKIYFIKKKFLYQQSHYRSATTGFFCYCSDRCRIITELSHIKGSGLANQHTYSNEYLLLYFKQLFFSFILQEFAWNTLKSHVAPDMQDQHNL